MALVPQAYGNSAEIAEQTARAYELKLRGASYRRIAQEMGISLGKAHNLVKQAIAERVDPLVEEYRGLELDKLEDAEAKLWVQIENGSPRQLPRNIEVLIKLSERRSKLLGMDAPERKEIEAVIEERAPEVLALIEQAEVQATEEEQRLRSTADGSGHG